MGVHAQFFEYLEALPDGVDLKNAILEYKANADEVAFAVNGYLRGRVPSNKYSAFAQRLAKAIRSQNTTPFTVYRMTTSHEFSAPLIPFKMDDKFPYLAFMSTSGSPENLGPFVQDHTIPVLLEIECPELTMMALMEGGDFGLEDEYLLGFGTTFRLIDVVHVTEAEHFQGVEWNNPHTEMFKVRLRVIENPKYTNGRDTFKFDPSAKTEDEPEVV